MRTKAGTSFSTMPAGDPSQGQVPDTDAVYAKYWTVIPHLVAGQSMIAIAQTCGINVRTLRRWMETPEFKQEYRLAKREHFDILANRLTAYADQAADTLIDLMRNGDPMMQLRAAKTIIQIAQKSAEIAQRTQTIAELQQINADKEALVEELETEVAELQETSETLVQLKSKLATGNFTRPEWFPEPNWNKIVQNNRHLDTAA
jgi:transposase-like protein